MKAAVYVWAVCDSDFALQRIPQIITHRLSRCRIGFIGLAIFPAHLSECRRPHECNLHVTIVAPLSLFSSIICFICWLSSAPFINLKSCLPGGLPPITEMLHLFCCLTLQRSTPIRLSIDGTLHMSTLRPRSGTGQGCVSQKHCLFRPYLGLTFLSNIEIMVNCTYFVFWEICKDLL